MNLFELGQALRTTRISQRLTQRDLASRTGVSLSSISGLERGSLSEIGTVKLLQLFAAVNLELQPRMVGQRRTLDDVNAENIRTSHTGQGELAQSQVQRYSVDALDTIFISSDLKKIATNNELTQSRRRVRHSRKG